MGGGGGGQEYALKFWNRKSRPLIKSRSLYIIIIIVIVVRIIKEECDNIAIDI